MEHILEKQEKARAQGRIVRQVPQHTQIPPFIRIDQIIPQRQEIGQYRSDDGDDAKEEEPLFPLGAGQRHARLFESTHFFSI